jgi:hypothetical protein
LASSLFYGGQLINGVTSEQRNPFIQGFAPIVFFDVASGVEAANESGSFVNNEVPNWTYTMALFSLLMSSLLMVSWWTLLNTGGYVREITRGWYVGSRCKGYTGDVLWVNIESCIYYALSFSSRLG